MALEAWARQGGGPAAGPVWLGQRAQLTWPLTREADYAPFHFEGFSHRAAADDKRQKKVFSRSNPNCPLPTASIQTVAKWDNTTAPCARSQKKPVAPTVTESLGGHPFLLAASRHELIKVRLRPHCDPQPQNHTQFHRNSTPLKHNFDATPPPAIARPSTPVLSHAHLHLSFPLPTSLRADALHGRRQCLQRRI
ncbi:uncharacterized protein VTP21DRAFT_1661 [Calcarisporiella thermophila]|uniref:uncharacterized protein n=1 Tax=Calcarisporiella thermophila TaxID=911321 RepID=UPI0037428909